METDVPVPSDYDQYALLKAAVRDRPADYDAHLSLVGYLRRRKRASLDLLKARREFASRFPLSPELWEAWIEDRNGAGGEDTHKEVLALYRRAFEDYQCTELWPGYLETLEESLDEDDGDASNTMREAFEEALGKVGVHPILGGAIWRAYLRFEKDELEDAEETDADSAEVSKALERVKRLYRRQLSVPLAGNDEVLPEMGEAFDGDGDGLKEVCRGHAQAVKMLAARMEHEQAIAKCQMEDTGGLSTANAWVSYAAMEAEDGHPSRAVFVLERAESEGCCLHEKIWLMHSDLLLGGAGAKGLEATLTARAVRNLPWSSELWCRRLRSVERSTEWSSEREDDRDAKAAKAVRAVWRQALSSALPSPDDYVKVLLAYCAFRRRRLTAVVTVAAATATATAEAAAKSRSEAMSDDNTGAGEGMIGPALPPPAPSRKADASVGVGVGVGVGVDVCFEMGGGGGGGGGADISSALEDVRMAFEEAETFVEKNYPGWDEGWLTLIRQRIDVEEAVVKEVADLGLEGVDIESQAGRQWERALRHSGKLLTTWLEAVAWERRTTGDLAACRRIFPRAMKEVQDYPEAACSAFLNFEQEVGSLEDWDVANKEVFKSRAARDLLSKDLPLASRSWTGGVAALPLHQPTSREQRDSAKRESQSHSGGGNLRRDRGQQRHRERQRGHERVSREVSGSSSKRRQREGDRLGAGVEDDGGGGGVRKRQRAVVQASVVPGRSSVEKNEGGFDERKNDATGSTGAAGTKNAAGSVGSGVIPGSNANHESTVDEIEDQKEEHGEKEQIKTKKKKKKKKKEGEGIVAGDVRWPGHETTVFVRGLGAGATSADLREAFEGKGLGSVVEARIVEDKKTHETKDYGYVQFEEPEAVVKALALDGTELCGGSNVKITRSRHPAVIPSSAPAPGKEKASSASSSATSSTSNSRSKDEPGGGTKKASDWLCGNPKCGNMCFSFRTRCNRCGIEKGVSYPERLPTTDGAGSGGGVSTGEVSRAHRPRLVLGMNVKPRALRNEHVTNGDVSSQAPPQEAGEGEKGEGMPPPLPVRKSNADFRAMFSKK